jgi:hypothetical protein
MRCRTLAFAGALAALAGSAVSAPALAAARPAQGPAPSAHASGLLDGLVGGGGLGGLIGGVAGGQQQPLQNLLGLLQGGQAPTAGLLDPVQRLLAQLGGTAGLPTGTQDLIAQVQALLASGTPGQPLSGNILMPVATLLRDLATTDGVPADVATLLNQLADSLDADGTVAGLPVNGLSLPATLIAQLDDVLRQLENGGRPTGRLLAPVAALLDQVATTDGLPPAVSDLLRQLGDTLEGTVGALDPLLTSQVTLALRTIAGTPGVSTNTRTTLERIATLLGSSGQAATSGGTSGKARVATARDRAVIKRVRVNKARTRIGVRVACPRSAPATCATLVSASFAGHRAAVGKRVRIGAGHAKLVRLRMVRTARASSGSHGGRLRVRVGTSFGTQHFAVAKTVRLAATPR